MDLTIDHDSGCTKELFDQFLITQRSDKNNAAFVFPGTIQKDVRWEQIQSTQAGVSLVVAGVLTPSLLPQVQHVHSKDADVSALIEQFTSKLKEKQYFTDLFDS